jgi:hypothetical protein
MRRVALALCATVAMAAAGVGSASSMSKATLCVRAGGHCFSTIQAAVDAARDGDTIQIGPGTFAGGVSIDKSVNLVGAGAGATVVRGGGPVLTIGAFGAASEPTVSISGVTLTGGITNSSPESVPFVGADLVVARGGGIEIPPNADFSGGATVTISNSVISGNRVAPTATLPIGPPCPTGPCPYAGAYGGGIDNWGAVTLTNSAVSNNQVGGLLASDAEGGGIWSLGSLTLSHSVVSGNSAAAAAPNGRFVNAGGIFAVSGALAIDSSVVNSNSADLSTSFPNSVDQGAGVGGIHVTDSTTATISNTLISGNSATATNTVGDANAFSGGVHADASITLSNDTISNNKVTVTALPGSSGGAYGDSGAGELGGTISNTRFIGNTVTATSATGTASATAGATIFTGSITESTVTGNRVSATSGTGSAEVSAGGLVAGGTLDMRNTVVSGNTGTASGTSGFAEGGGIANYPLPGGPPLGLTLTNSLVTHNSLSGSPGITIQGGGIFTTDPVKLLHSLVAQNQPDQCYGC